MCGLLAVVWILPKPLPSASHSSPGPVLNTGAWDDGYNQGVPIGKTWGGAGRSIPSQVELHSSAVTACRSNVHTPGEDQWVRGFESGFAQGYKEITKPAF